MWLGLDKGIRRLSNANVILAFVFLVFILFAGDTLFLLRNGGQLGRAFTATFYGHDPFGTDPLGDSGFVEDWTVFYWAWWIAYGPFVGLFVTRISPRAIDARSPFLACLVLGSLGCWLFFLLLGNHSLGLQFSGELDVIGIMNDTNGSAAMVAGLNTLPMSGLVIALFCLVSIIFCATTYDSASYTLAASATQAMHPNDDPPRWHRLFWAIAVAVLPIGLMFAGGIREAQTAVLVVSIAAGIDVLARRNRAAKIAAC